MKKTSPRGALGALWAHACSVHTHVNASLSPRLLPFPALSKPKTSSPRFSPPLRASALKPVIPTLLLLLLPALSFAAETAQQRGKRVVDEAIAALGGDAFMRVQDRVETGRAYSFYNGRISGLSIAAIYTRYLSNPGPPVIGRLEVEEKEAFAGTKTPASSSSPPSPKDGTSPSAAPAPSTRSASPATWITPSTISSTCCASA